MLLVLSNIEISDVYNEAIIVRCSVKKLFWAFLRDQKKTRQQNALFTNFGFLIRCLIAYSFFFFFVHFFLEMSEIPSSFFLF